jgi:hypothetical protein
MCQYSENRKFTDKEIDRKESKEKWREVEPGAPFLDGTTKSGTQTKHPRHTKTNM